MVRITLLVIFLLIISERIKAYHQHSIFDVVENINHDKHIEYNVIIDLFKNHQNVKLNELLQRIQLPLLHITEATADKIQPLFKRFSQQSLIIARINLANLNKTIEVLDSLLWTIHFKDILFVYDIGEASKENYALWYPQNDLYEIASSCWHKGFISVLIWLNHQLYTYHPYPSIKIKQIFNLTEYYDKSHLENFHQYVFNIPVFEFPPLCFSYINRKGELLRVGYVYSWIKLFLEHHNATIHHHFFDLWSYNVTHKVAFEVLTDSNFAFIPVILTFSEFYASSYCLFFYKNILLVPAPKEIYTGFYTLISFDSLVWFTVLISVIIFYILINFIYYFAAGKLNWGQAFQDAFKIILFLSIKVKTKYYFSNFVLYLLFLFTGIFITNYYSSSLSSLYTSKVYEPKLQYIEDISRNKHQILEYTSEVPLWLLRNMSSIFINRLVTNRNNVLFKNRINLNMNFMYTAAEHMAEFILFRQRYLKRPIAMKLAEPLNYNAFVISMPHRSPVIDQFNRYLLYLRESGIFNKIFTDTQWHGHWSGLMKPFMDVEENKSLSLAYFHYIFYIWFFCLMCAFVCFLLEIYFHNRLSNI